MMSVIFDVLAYVLIITGIVFIAFGVFGMFRFNDFYARMLIASKIDTIGFITIMLGVIIKAGFGMFSLKALLVLLITVFINPVVNNAIARSAYYSDYRPERKENSAD